MTTIQTFSKHYYLLIYSIGNSYAKANYIGYPLQNKLMNESLVLDEVNCG